MKINISLPRPYSSEGTTEGVRSFLKQLELSVHHAQKSLDEMVRMTKESGGDGKSFSILYRIIGAVEDSDTGEVCECKVENKSTDYLELEIYE